jgi:hypothetical protein
MEVVTSIEQKFRVWISISIQSPKVTIILTIYKMDVVRCRVIQIYNNMRLSEHGKEGKEAKMVGVAERNWLLCASHLLRNASLENG